eukprot:531443-Rhodomonas_salina.4
MSDATLRCPSDVTGHGLHRTPAVVRCAPATHHPPVSHDCLYRMLDPAQRRACFDTRAVSKNLGQMKSGRLRWVTVRVTLG